METKIKTHREKPPILRFYVQNGGLAFTTSASEFLQIKIGDRIKFFQDEKNPKKWYFSIGKEDGLPMRLHTYEYSFRFGSKKLVNALIKAYRKNKLYFKKREEDGKTFYQLTGNST